MRQIIILIGLCFILNGCSFLKIASAPLQVTKNSVPQSTEQSKAKIICSKNAVFNEDGIIISCDGKYYNYNQNYEQADRKLTFFEKIAQMASKGLGYILWAVGISILLTMLGLGVWVGNFWTTTFSMGSKALKQIAKGVQKVKDSNPELIQALEKSTDENVKNWLKNYKIKNNIE